MACWRAFSSMQDKAFCCCCRVHFFYRHSSWRFNAMHSLKRNRALAPFAHAAGSATANLRWARLSTPLGGCAPHTRVVGRFTPQFVSRSQHV
eukprot:7056939-Prymnesium_polylepis.1